VVSTPAQTPPFDVLITGGQVLDGSGAAPQRVDVGIRGDRVAAIGQLSAQPARRTIDATGLVVAPGFIDLHSHGGLAILVKRRIPFELALMATGLVCYAMARLVPLAREWDTVLDGSRGIEWTTWFNGARLNIAEACVHRWAHELPDQEAAVWVPEEGERRTLTWDELSREVRRLAEALRGLGVGEGENRGPFGGYFCPCHRSSFTLDGAILDPKSPSPRPLDDLPVEIRNGTEIWVKFQNFRAGTHDKIPV